ncbi:MAG TPA: hypothetical protein VJG32_10555 [Anaerolineae bacterium]|nr:hypothetical protein [Anaerolineae bacterium]
MTRQTRITIYLSLITLGLAVLGFLYWDIYQYRRVLAVDPHLEYWLHVPGRCSAGESCPVFVFVHGTGGSGREYIKTWRGYADREGFILICPTFGDGYQRLANTAVVGLTAILDEVGQSYPVPARIILSGFSGGAQFAHRFAFAHPERVQAVAVHSAGSYDEPKPGAAYIPFLVTVGLDDVERVDLARWFADALEAAGYTVTRLEFEHLGHRLSEQAIQATVDFIRRAR